MPGLGRFGLFVIVAGSNMEASVVIFSVSEHLTGRCCDHVVCPWRQMRDMDSSFSIKEKLSLSTVPVNFLNISFLVN